MSTMAKLYFKSAKSRYPNLKILKKDELGQLRDYIPRNQLLVEYGGTCQPPIDNNYLPIINTLSENAVPINPTNCGHEFRILISDEIRSYSDIRNHNSVSHNISIKNNLKESRYHIIDSSKAADKHDQITSLDVIVNNATHSFIQKMSKEEVVDGLNIEHELEKEQIDYSVFNGVLGAENNNDWQGFEPILNESMNLQNIIEKSFTFDNNQCAQVNKSHKDRPENQINNTKSLRDKQSFEKKFEKGTSWSNDITTKHKTSLNAAQDGINCLSNMNCTMIKKFGNNFFFDGEIDISIIEKYEYKRFKDYEVYDECDEGPKHQPYSNEIEKKEMFKECIPNLMVRSGDTIMTKDHKNKITVEGGIWDSLFCGFE